MTRATRMIEINQVAALRARSLLHLAYDPGRDVADHMRVRIRAESSSNRAFE
jgi:hypothetical protein